MTRDDVDRLVFAAVGRGATIDEDPTDTIDRFVTNWRNGRYSGGLDAIRDELGLAPVRDELVDLLAWSGRERWAGVCKRRAAQAAVLAGCPLRVAAEAAGVSHQTVANWAAAGRSAPGAAPVFTRRG